MIAGCTTASSTNIAPISCPADSTLTYANFGEAFVSDHCLSCHASQTPTFTTQAQIVSNRSRMLQEAVYTDAMPEDGTMTTAAREMLGEWLACGAP